MEDCVIEQALEIMEAYDRAQGSWRICEGGSIGSQNSPKFAEITIFLGSSINYS